MIPYLQLCLFLYTCVCVYVCVVVSVTSDVRLSYLLNVIKVSQVELKKKEGMSIQVSELCKKKS